MTKIVPYLIILIFIVLIYYPTFEFTSQIYSIDYSIIISPLKEIHSLIDYIQGIKNFKIYDLQPVKDLSYFFDLFLINNFSENINFHLLTNLIILFICCLLINNILTSCSNFEKKNIKVILFTLIFLCHPITTQTFAHITQRKHILAFLFILLFLENYLKEKSDKSNAKDQLSRFIYYLLSLLSSPLALLFPIWYFFDLLLRKKLSLRNTLISATPSLGIGLFFGVLNFWYYQYYLSSYLYAANQVNLQFSLGDFFLQLGRSYSQFFIPTSFAQFYAPDSLLNIIGVFLIFLIPYFTFKLIKNSDQLILVLSFFTLSIILNITPLINLREFLLVDSYLIISSVTLIIFLHYLSQFLIKPQNKKFEKIILVTTCVALTLLFFQSSKISNLFQSKTAYLKQSYLNEPHCRNLYMLAKQYLVNKDIKNLVIYGKKTMEDNCFIGTQKDHSTLVILLNYIVYFRDDISTEEKISFFKNKPKLLRNIFPLIGLLKKENQTIEVDIVNLLNSEINHVGFEMAKNAIDDKLIAADIIRSCKLNFDKSCEILFPFLIYSNKTK